MMRFITFLLLSFSALAQGPQLEIQASATDYFKSVVNESLNLLPADYLNSNKGKITINMLPLRNDANISEDLCELGELELHGSVFGQTRKRRNNHEISISSRLVELAQSNYTHYECSHGTFEKLLQATIIHELTHVKDNFERISVEADFQRMVGVKKVQRSSRKRVLNQNTSTSPDAYEFKNLEEALAVNVEYLILDPEFECRRPATANYLSRRLGIALKNQCSKNYKIMTQSAYLEDNYQHTASINPSRIYQVHYLFAGKGRALMSRWGHAMFRLIVCAPHRKQVGPECLNDVSHHLALTYRAYMTDMNVSYMRGIRGEYPSQLFIMRFHEVQQEYTKFDLRDLFSIPLRMTENQKKDFIDLTLERFWTYQGKYYFFNNNCGTETQKHLAFALEEDQAALIRSITPLRIYRDIMKAENELAQAGVAELKRREKVEQGFLVPSMYKEYEETYQYLRYHGIFREKKFKRFLKSHLAHMRLTAYEDYFAQAELSPEENRMLILKVIHLERYLAGRFVQELPKKAMRVINNDRALKEEVMRMSEGFKSLATQPWEIVPSAYGVPTADEFDQEYPRFLEERQQQSQMSAENQIQDLQTLLGGEQFKHDLYEIEWLKLVRRFHNQQLIKSLGI